MEVRNLLNSKNKGVKTQNIGIEVETVVFYRFSSNSGSDPTDFDESQKACAANGGKLWEPGSTTENNDVIGRLSF